MHVRRPGRNGLGAMDPGGTGTPVPGLPEAWKPTTLGGRTVPVPVSAPAPTDVRVLRGFCEALPPPQVVPFHRFANLAYTNSLAFSANIDEFRVPSAQFLVITSVIFRVFVNSGDGMTELGGNSNPYFTSLRVQFRFSADSLNSPGQYAVVNTTAATTFAGIAATGTNVADLLGWRDNFGLVIRGGGQIVTSYSTSISALFAVTVPDRVSSEIGGFLAPHQYVEDYFAVQSK